MLDYNNHKKSLWQKLTPKLNTNIVHQFLTIKNNSIKIIMLDLNDYDYVYKVKYSRILKGYVIQAKFVLHFIQFQVIEDANNFHQKLKSMQILYALTIQKELTLITTSESDYQFLKEKLSFFCIKTNFQENLVVEKAIGNGAFAKVYKARFRENGKLCAIKAFSKEYLKKVKYVNQGVATVKNEIMILRKVNNCARIIKLLEVYESEHSIYLVQELMEGDHLLKRFMQKSGRPKLLSALTLKIMENLLKAVQQFHALNIMHRDLKPENIIFRSKDNDTDIVVIDFGLAMEENQPVVMKRCGTPGFIAPEIINFRKGLPFYDKKCDVYSLGIIFYILLTGENPFIGNPEEKLEKNKISDIDFNIPILQHKQKETLNLLQAMLKKDPVERISVQQVNNYQLISKAIEHPAFKMVQFDEQLSLNFDRSKSTEKSPRQIIKAFQSFQTSQLQVPQNQRDQFKQSTSCKEYSKNLSSNYDLFIPENLCDGNIQSLCQFSQYSNASLILDNNQIFNAVPSRQSLFQKPNKEIKGNLIIQQDSLNQPNNNTSNRETFQIIISNKEVNNFTLPELDDSHHLPEIMETIKLQKFLHKRFEFSDSKQLSLE